jgi:tetratricopeptide (TPR) repeat protein
MRLGRSLCFLFSLLVLAAGAMADGAPAPGKTPPQTGAPFNVLDEAAKAREKGDDELAAQIYTRAIDDTAVPDRYRLTYLLERGRIELAGGNLGRALADMNAAVGLIDSEPSPRVRGGVYSLRGFLLADLGRREEAVQDLQLAYTLRTKPDPDFDRTIEPLRQSSPEFATFMDEEAERILDAIERKLRELGGWE